MAMTHGHKLTEQMPQGDNDSAVQKHFPVLQGLLVKQSRYTVSADSVSQRPEVLRAQEKEGHTVVAGTGSNRPISCHFQFLGLEHDSESSAFKEDLPCHLLSAKHGA